MTELTVKIRPELSDTTTDGKLFHIFRADVLGALGVKYPKDQTFDNGGVEFVGIFDTELQRYLTARGALSVVPLYEVSQVFVRTDGDLLHACITETIDFARYLTNAVRVVRSTIEDLEESLLMKVPAKRREHIREKDNRIFDGLAVQTRALIKKLRKLPAVDDRLKKTVENIEKNEHKFLEKRQALQNLLTYQAAVTVSKNATYQSHAIKCAKEASISVEAEKFNGNRNSIRNLDEEQREARSRAFVDLGFKEGQRLTTKERRALKKTAEKCLLEIRKSKGRKRRRRETKDEIF